MSSGLRNLRASRLRGSALGGGIEARSSLRRADDLPMVPVGGNELQQSLSFSSRQAPQPRSQQLARVMPVEIAEAIFPVVVILTLGIATAVLSRMVKVDPIVGYLFLGMVVSSVPPRASFGWRNGSPAPPARRRISALRHRPSFLDSARPTRRGRHFWIRSASGRCVYYLIGVVCGRSACRRSPHSSWAPR